MLIRRNAVEVWHVTRIEKRGGDLSPGISARLTAVVLTKLGDVSTVAKTLVE
eukprot:CAMPEP_0179478656 /NCGR_PEP_ID=MMETSP0799-20121207/57082_1 /TAXON_ID=46947 /ORGANISM="Geminigera cryophila, Strain CCMP2564" /LENGTH=51 /DNA_ID=CAMNT_0021289877 /DNA_START=85 /DNA_END=237 /DNA_ORIENTATION=-